MFANQRRGSAGLGALFGVGLVLVAWLFGTGLLIKVYRDGGAAGLQSQCELVCRGGEKSGGNT